MRQLSQPSLLSLLLTLILWSLPAAGLQEPDHSANVSRLGNPSGIARHFEKYLYGVVKKITDKEIVLTETMMGTDQTFQFVKKTKFILDGKATKVGSIKVGDRVYVDHKEDKKGNLIAKKVLTGVFAAQSR